MREQDFWVGGATFVAILLLCSKSRKRRKMQTPYGNTQRICVENDYKGKFQATLARIYGYGMAAYSNGSDNPWKAGTQKHKAWQLGFQSGRELSRLIMENKAKDRRSPTVSQLENAQQTPNQSDGNMTA